MSKIPFIVRQPPGRNNALGQVKFMFPNKHSVFLHDTNHREYFAKHVRTTSSGCIRLRDPFNFADRLLQSRQKGWNRSRIDGVINSRKTKRVKLQKPLPILIQYMTASVTEHGVSFRDDIYGRDRAVLAELKKPFRLHLADLPKRTRNMILASVESKSKPVGSALVPTAEVIGVPSRGNFNSRPSGIRGFLDH